MSKKKRKLPKGDVVWKQTSDEATLAKKPHYNGFACGHGVHGDMKYNRTKDKRKWKQQLRQEGASRGSFLFGFQVYLNLEGRFGPLAIGLDAVRLAILHLESGRINNRIHPLY